MKIKSSYHEPGIIHIVCTYPYPLQAAFMRVQEYYESPHKDLRGKAVDLEQFLNLSAENSDKGVFAYFSGTGGFNLPGPIYKEWLNIMQDAGLPLTKYEIALKTEIDSYESLPEKFYIIGTYTWDSTLLHEFAHAFFYLVSDYRKKVSRVVSRLPYRKKFNKLLYQTGYHSSVYVDEIQAYLTDTKANLLEQFDDFRSSWYVPTAVRTEAFKLCKKFKINLDEEGSH